MNGTTVTNLATGQEISYSCPPNEAVVCAYEQYIRRNWNTWDYDYSQAKRSPSGKTWSCGDFAAPVAEKDIKESEETQ